MHCKSEVTSQLNLNRLIIKLEVFMLKKITGEGNIQHRS